MITLSVLVVLAVGLGFYSYCGRSVRAEIDIAAAPERVWQILIDTSHYHEWQPTMIALEGVVRRGETLKLVVKTAVGERIFYPTLLVVEPNRALAWRVRGAFPGLLHARHDFHIAAKGDGGAHFVQRERLFGWQARNLDTDAVRRNFELMNTALKDRAERR